MHTIDELNYEVFKTGLNYDIDNIGDIKVTKLPNDLNPDKLLDDAIKKKYGTTCPYCGSYNLGSSFEHDYKRIEGHWWEFWKTNWCKRKEYACAHCGMKWLTPWYPQDLNEKLLKG